MADGNPNPNPDPNNPNNNQLYQFGSQQQSLFNINGGNKELMPLHPSNLQPPDITQWRQNNAPKYTQAEKRNFSQARNPRLVTSASARIVNDNGNIMMENTKNGREIMNSFMSEPPAPDNNQQGKYFGVFNHTVGAFSMAKVFASHHPPSTKFSALFLTLPANVSVESLAQNKSLPLLPFTEESSLALTKRRKIDINGELCANCNQESHRLCDCVSPVSLKFGDIYGCPLCNTKNHSFDGCPHQGRMSDKDRLEWLVLRREGKPMIRSNIEIYILVLKMVVEKKLDPATVKLPWDRRTVIPMIMQEDAAKELANWSYTPDITTPVYHDPNVEVGNLPTVLSQGFTGSFATFKASDYFKKHKSQKNLPHSQPQPHNQPQPPIQPQPQPQPQLQPQQPIQPQQPQLDQEETKQRAHRLAQQQHALRLAHQRASMDVDQTPPGGSMGIHMEPVEEAYQNRKRSGGPHLGK